MSTSFENLGKNMEQAFSPEHMKACTKTFVESMTTASEFNSVMARMSIEAVGSVHHFWKQGAETMLDSQKRFTETFAKMLNHDSGDGR